MSLASPVPSVPAATIVDRLWAPSTHRTRAIVREATLVVGFALLTALAAQIKISLGFTPVPITGQTFAVLLAGGALGARSGALSQLLYWVMALVGFPVLAWSPQGRGGWARATGSSMGYLVGFIVAAALVGYLAERRHDRNLASSVAAMAFGSMIIYVFGAAWLAYKLEIPVATGTKNAISLGVTPFLIGDLVKLLLAGAILPAAWSASERFKKS